MALFTVKVCTGDDLALYKRQLGLGLSCCCKSAEFHILVLHYLTSLPFLCQETAIHLPPNFSVCYRVFRTYRSTYMMPNRPDKVTQIITACTEQWWPVRKLAVVSAQQTSLNLLATAPTHLQDQWQLDSKWE